MNKFLFCLFFLGLHLSIFAQVSSKYTISFENAVHHEANIEAVFTNLRADEVE